MHGLSCLAPAVETATATAGRSAGPPATRTKSRGWQNDGGQGRGVSTPPCKTAAREWRRAGFAGRFVSVVCATFGKHVGGFVAPPYVLSSILMMTAHQFHGQLLPTPFSTNHMINPLFRLFGCVLCFLLAPPLDAFAQPTAVKIVVAFAPGGSIDRQARILAQQLQLQLGRTVIVENVPGAGGAIGQQVVSSGPNDGSIWLFHSGIGKAGTELLTPAFQAGEGAIGIYARPGSNANQMLSSNKSLATGPGSPGEVVAQALLKSGKFAAVIPFRGVGQASHYVLEQDMLLVAGLEVGGNAFGLSLVAASDDGLAAKMSLPSFSQVGLADSSIKVWSGVFAPVGTPSAVIQSMAQASMQVSRSSEFTSFLRSVNWVPAPRDSRAFGDVLDAGHAYAMASGSAGYRELAGHIQINRAAASSSDPAVQSNLPTNTGSGRDDPKVSGRSLRGR